MPTYTAPLRDMQFVLHELLESETHYSAIQGGEDATPDMVDAILQEGGKFCEQVLSPLYRVGDQEGCTWSEEGVTTPTGWKEAYEQYVEGGWPAMCGDAEYGGQGLPESIGIVLSEMIGSANWAWGMYPGLSHGAINTISLHGTDEQKQAYLPKLLEGTWTGTMCLTEPHCGSDLGILKSRATPNDDGSYSISGTKIFISAGDHDMAENIIHIVLARLPDAPEGTKGISLFIVPKVLEDGQGNLTDKNAVSCGSLEEKMGIHGNATCVMNFDDAKGYLIGPANGGLKCMFTFMNTARIGTALQGQSAAEASFQGALEYAKERLAMRSLKKPVCPDKPADPIIVHPDVRRMLLTQKAYAEGGRALLYYCGFLVDQVEHGQGDEVKQEADDMLSFLTPIAKAFLTEAGVEATNLGVQVFGGHGYIQEWGMEQLVRDTRIATIYEGTTGIQALDLLGRKVLLTKGELLKKFTKRVHKFCKANEDNRKLKALVEPLNALNKEWGDLTMKIGMKAMMNKEVVGGAAVDYLMYSGYITLGYFLAWEAQVAHEKLVDKPEDKDFYQAKLKLVDFYFQRILPRTKSHADIMLADLDTLMDLEEDHFTF